jgi:hypothetical protein
MAHTCEAFYAKQSKAHVSRVRKSEANKAKSKQINQIIPAIKIIFQSFSLEIIIIPINFPCI